MNQLHIVIQWNITLQQKINHYMMHIATSIWINFTVIMQNDRS